MDKFRVRYKLGKESVWYELSDWTPADGYISSWDEPAQAIDAAEEKLIEEAGAIPGEAFAEISYNSDEEPHYRLFLLEPEREGQTHFGLFNTGVAKWEVIYPPGYGENMQMPPSWWEDEKGEGEAKVEDDDEGEHAEDENADMMDLGAEDDEDEMDDDEADGDEGEDEKDEESEGENDDEGDNESEADKEEAEMPRLAFFSKMRGPKGWRKRAESDPEREFNRFEFKIGVLDPDEEQRSSWRERDNRVHVRFSESDQARDVAELRIRVPEGVEWEQKGKWLVAEIPTQGEM